MQLYPNGHAALRPAGVLLDRPFTRSALGSEDVTENDDCKCCSDDVVGLMYSLLILYFSVAIVTSFMCSMWEAVLLSITPSYARMKQREGHAVGDALQAFKRNVDRPLAAILTLNTIAHTVGAIGVGEQATRIWADSNPLLTAVVVPVLMTLGILILSEIIPKTLGANYWRELAPFTVRSLKIIIKLLAPLVWLSQRITRLLRREKSGSVLSRSEFLAMTELGVKEGMLEETESDIIRNLLRFQKVQAKDIMTPRPVVQVASEDMTLQELFQRQDEMRFSRIPLYSGTDREEITGYVLKDELLVELAEGRGDQPLSRLQREIVVIHESFAIPNLLSHFFETREHIALVVDEFGGVSGIVTMEDVIETLLGMEIIDEMDDAEDMQKLARENWTKRARHLGLVDQEPE